MALESEPAPPMREQVEQRLREWFALRRRSLGRTAPEGYPLFDAVADLTLREGKRLRPRLLGAAFDAVDRTGERTGVLDAAASLELLQTFLLIHDDWMDGDTVRRGGPAVHVAFSEQHGVRAGASLAILAGNLASSFSWELLLGAARARGAEDVVEVFHRMHQQVLVGQQLDLLGGSDISLMHRLKTGSYTVAGPLEMGARLGGASERQRQSLSDFAAPLGEAFQLRDDLLGVFGDPRRTGKPASDLQTGRPSSLLAAAKDLSAEDRARIEAARRPDASGETVDAARAILERCGARARVEARLESLLERAVSPLRSAPLSASGIEQLTRLASALALREA